MNEKIFNPFGWRILKLILLRCETLLLSQCIEFLRLAISLEINGSINNSHDSFFFAPLLYMSYAQRLLFLLAVLSSCSPFIAFLLSWPFKNVFNDLFTCEILTDSNWYSINVARFFSIALAYDSCTQCISFIELLWTHAKWIEKENLKKNWSRGWKRCSFQIHTHWSQFAVETLFTPAINHLVQ